MAEPTRSLRVAKIDTQVFGSVSAEQAWVPAVNVYECGHAVHVCVELAGVLREALSVTVEPGRLVIEGRRAVPKPPESEAQCVRAMEIDHGLFRRVLNLPENVNLDNVSKEMCEGLLWILLPMAV